MPEHNPLFSLINDLTNEVRSNWGTQVITGPLGYLEVEYVEAEDSEEPDEGDYCNIALMLPYGVYVVTDGDTYGELYAIRIYKNDGE